MPTYNRTRVRNYALRWAEDRNPDYPDYSRGGGDCTNFASQCMRAGGFPMGLRSGVWSWWGSSLGSGKPWRVVADFQRYFRVKGWATPCDWNELDSGDLVFLGRQGASTFTTHVMVVSRVEPVRMEHPTAKNHVFLCGHTLDQTDNPLWVVAKNWGVQFWKVADACPRW
jgi:hypothetical protein